MAVSDVRQAASEYLRQFASEGQREGDWYAKRAEAMRRAHAIGMTYWEIGVATHLSQERVSAIIKKHMGICPTCGRCADG